MITVITETLKTETGKKGNGKRTVKRFRKISNGDMSVRDNPIHFMFGSTWGFRGRRTEWRYFQFDQIQ